MKASRVSMVLPTVLALSLGGFLAYMTAYPGHRMLSAKQQLQRAQRAFYQHAQHPQEEPLFKVMQRGHREIKKQDQSDKVLGSKEVVKSVNDIEQKEGKFIVPKNRPVIHPHKYKVILESPDICGSEEVLLLILVMSEVDRYKRRAIIRQTWGNPENHQGASVRLAFVTGNQTVLPMLQAALQHEAKTYKDLYQEDFPDIKQDAITKTLAGFTFVSKHCAHAKFVMKAEDRMFINIFTVINHLQQMAAGGFLSGYIMGLVMYNWEVSRKGYFAVSEKVFPNTTFPTFCSTQLYFMSSDVMHILLEASYYLKPFSHIEDVYITGMLPWSLNKKLEHTNINLMFVPRYEFEELFVHPTEWHKYAFTHIQDWDVDVFLRIWNKMAAIANTHTIPTVEDFRPGRLTDIYLPKKDIVKNPDAPYNRNKDNPK